MSNRSTHQRIASKFGAKPLLGRQHDLLERLSFWPLQFGGWALYTVFPLGAWMLGGLPSSTWLWLAFTRGPSGFVVTSALRPLCHRLFAARIHYALLFPLLVVAAVVLSILEFEVMRRLGTSLGLASKSLNGGGTHLGFLLLRSSVLLLWLVMYFSIKSLQQHAEAEREFHEAEGRLLRSQMSPHFLFNALTTIMAVRKDEEKVATITQSLADYLRFSLQQQGEEHGPISHPLGDELDALGDYLQVEKARFGADLVWRIDADKDARRITVPSALVQPLLENAIKYGQQTGPRPLIISITAQVVQGTLRVDVQNSGHWVEPDSNRAGRIGLSNLKRRLELLYGNSASLDTRHTPSMVKVCVSLPIHTAA